MATTPSLEDSQVLIARQLHTLHLTTNIAGGGESVRASVETDQQGNEEDTKLQDDILVKTEQDIKVEELSEDERSRASTPSYREDDDVEMAKAIKAEQQKLLSTQLERDDFIVIDEADLGETRLQLRREMEDEKERFTGASNWAPEEVHLFELLYMRQHLSLMPRHWAYDFAGVPFQDHVFHTSEENPPVIFAHSRETEFRGTKGLMNIVDLSSRVLTLLQSGFQGKAPGLIAKTLNDFLAWSAADGGFHTLEIIPNMIVEVVAPGADHVAVIRTRMEALAQLHRDFLRQDRDDYGWQGVKSEVLDQGFLMAGSPPRSSKSRANRRISVRDVSPKQRATLAAAASAASSSIRVAGQKRKRSAGDQMAAPGRRKRAREDSYDDSNDQAPRTPANKPRRSKYARQPPVIWGMFIINTSVFLCTLDASKEGKSAYVSWHDELAFSQTKQCVWHALTVALVVCLARDELMTRLADFQVLSDEPEEDPDR